MKSSITARKSARGSFCFFKSATGLVRDTAGKSLLILFALMLALPATSFAAGKVVISQAYGGGGNSGSKYKNDFIELFNSGNAAISLNGWSVQYAGATGTSWQVTNLTNVSLQPGQYYLVQEAAGTGGTTSLPTADATGSIAMASGAFKVAVVSSTTALTGACPTGLIDYLSAASSGAGLCVEGSNGPAVSNTLADARNTAGCTDTDNDGADFTAVDTTAVAYVGPRNTATTKNPCAGTPPTGTGNASPNTLDIGDTALLTIATTQGSPASAISSVTVDLSAFGGSSTQSLFDNGSNGDITANDGTYSLNFTIPAGTAGGPYTVNATITDALNRIGTATISFTVNAPTAIVATGAANPTTLGVGAQTLLTAVVTPGTNPASTSLMVVADLSAIGGSATQAFYDDGSNGDATSGDGTYSFLATIAGSSSGSISIPVTVTDAQLRSASTSIALTIVPELSIMDIQGHGGRSPYAGPGTTLGSLLKTPSAGHTNIVTALKISGTSNGFFMQDSVGDGDLTTSDAIFVFTGATVPTVAIGDSVVVTGKVQEFSGSSEIAGSPTVTKVGTGTVPAAYDLTANLPSTDPTQGICMGAGSTIVVPTATAENDGYQASNFACLDGMLVKMSDGVVVAPTSGSGGSGIKADSVQFFYATAGNPRPFREPGLAPGDTNKTASYAGPLFDGDPEIIEIYYPGLKLDTTTLPNAGSGPGVYNARQHINLTGIIQGFQASGGALTYEMYPRSGSDLVLNGAAPTYPIPVADAVPGKLTVGSQNGLHFFNASADGADTSQYNDTCTGNGSSDTCPTPAQYDARLTKMSLQIRTVLKAPVVQVMQEVENLSVLTDLANRIHQNDASITYTPYLIPGNDPGGINIGILVRQGVTVNSVSQLAKPTLTDSCSSGTGCLLNDRPPFLLDAVYQGYHFRVLAIYDRSLLSLGVNDYVGTKRRAEAEQVARIVQVLQTDNATLSGNDVCDAQFDGTSTLNPSSCPVPITGSSTIPFVVVGDFNAYEFSDGYVDVTGTIMGTVDTDPTHSVYPPTAVGDAYGDPAYAAPSPQLFNSSTPTLDKGANPDTWNDNYSYTFDGYAQEIDHILMSSVANNDFVVLSHAHGNADVSSSGPDSDGSAANLPTFEASARRSSDHDGQVIEFGYVVNATAGSNGGVTTAHQSADSATVGKNGTTSFTFIANAGYHFGTPSSTCGGSFDSDTGIYTTAAVTADCTVSVSFAIDTFALNYDVNNPSAGHLDGTTSQTVNYGDDGTTVTAVAETGYHFVQWSDGVMTAARTDTDVMADISVTADFAINTYTLTYSVDDPLHGSISGTTPQTVNDGADGTSVSANASTGYHFVQWSDGVMTATRTDTAVHADITVTAQFAINSYNVTATVDVSHNQGTITPPSQSVDYNGTATFTVTPNTGYHASVSGDTCTVTQSSSNTWTSSTITADCAVTATFTPGYVSVTPARILDTRSGGSTSDHAFEGGGAVGAHAQLDLSVIGRGGVPNTGVSAVVVNVTLTNPTATGFVTVWPTGSTRPTASNLNFVAGNTISNLVIVKLGTSGQISLFNSAGSTDLIADVVGYFTDVSDLQSFASTRLLDTRTGRTTADGMFEGGGALGVHGQIDLGLAGRSGLPAAGDLGAVIMNVTATDTTASGFVTVWPTDESRPTASTLNFVAAQTIPNLVVGKVSSTGEVSLFNSAGSTDLIGDVSGYFPSTSTDLMPLTAARLLDTRAGRPTVDGQFETGAPLASKTPFDLTVTGRGGVPANATGAVVLNITVTQPAAAGFLVAWPSGTTRPTTSSINFAASQTIANLAIVHIGADGKISLYNNASTDAIVDVVGYLPGN